MRGLISRYIKDIIFGANDGIVTTFAVVAGSIGAGLSADVILILGFASLLADGFSMGAGNYLGSHSEREVAMASGEEYIKSVRKPALFTFFSFILAGALPLVPFATDSENSFALAIVMTAITLFTVGAVLGAIVNHRHWFALGFEMLTIGGMAAAIAYFIGFVVKQIIGV